jgi:hypothetical protein
MAMGFSTLCWMVLKVQKDLGVTVAHRGAQQVMSKKRDKHTQSPQG